MGHGSLKLVKVPYYVLGHDQENMNRLVATMPKPHTPKVAVVYADI